ncbi:hypothetical protein STA3757_29210 [Stanieria sp. NIES-3757]|nr:hypothetical protein STA3757_29210 [Stanieria sp. NIES-3757]
MMSIAIGRAILLERSPMRYFGENGFITWLSICQLLFIAYLCWKINRLRFQENFQVVSWKNPKIFWQILTLGFIFLALDEYWEFHENFDKTLHIFLNLNDAGITGRMDDFIVLLYALFGLFFLHTFKNEFQKFISASRWFLTGFSLSFLTIFLDMLSHNREILSLWIKNHEQLNNAHHWFTTIEEIPKIFAEGAFIIAFYYCLLIAKKLKKIKVESSKNYSLIK